MHRHDFVFDGQAVECSTEKRGAVYEVRVGEKLVEVHPLGTDLFAATLNGQKKIIAAEFNKGVCYLEIDSVQLELREPGDEGFAGSGADLSAVKDKIFAPMPGRIVKILVNVGDTVKEKQPLVIVEAMKMENPVSSRACGRIKAINVQAEQQVDTETPLIELDIQE
ncbi:MAG TPA: acetyl-CoA carboxylase biotin carboxyl carrier protein subunit [Acidobacteriota bacterium]|nr:acetyl-CoA carboxylase biotin carboxyl carrier protein subunit [Acidobacteriota bacterium]